MKKILFLSLFLVLSLVVITGCGNKLSEYAGTYKLDYAKYVGDPDTAKDTDSIETIILNDDGTGQSIRDGLNIKVEWKLTGDEITLTEIYAGIKLDYNGILRGNKLDLFDGDKTNDLTLEKIYIKE